MNYEKLNPTEIGLRPGYGNDVNPGTLTRDQLMKLQDLINSKLNDELKWWEEWGIKGRVDVKVDAMIEDNDFQLMDLGIVDGIQYYELYSDCDRYRFEGSFIFDREMTKLYFSNDF